MFNSEEIKEGKQFTGVTRCKVLAINPDGQWLFDNGFRKEIKDVEYTYNFGGDNTGNKVSIYLQSLENDTVKGNVDFLIADIPKISKSGKNYYTDGFGADTWAEDVSTAKYLDKDTAIHTSKDLSKLIRLIRVWTRIAKEKSVELDLIKLNTGDFSELVVLADKAEKASKEGDFQFGVKALFGVNEKGYTAIYNNSFIRIDSSKVANMKKALEDEYSGFKADYQNSLEFKEYVENLSTSAREEITPDDEIGEDLPNF